MAGWIKIQRDLVGHWCSSDPYFLAVWVRLLAEANFKDEKKFINGVLIEVKRGHLIYGREAFSARSKVSVSKLRRIMKLLEEDGMISQQKTNKYTIVSITKYKDYQVNDQQKTIKPPTGDQQTTTLEEGKQGEEGKDIIKSKKPRASSLKDDWSLPEDYRQWVKDKNICNDDNFITRVSEHFKNHHLSKGNTMKSWKAAWRTWCSSGYTKWPEVKKSKLSEDLSDWEEDDDDEKIINQGSFQL